MGGSVGSALKDWLEEKAPWLVKNFNGAQWETKQAKHERCIRALESGLTAAWAQINSLQFQLCEHAQGRKHKPQPERIPAPDEE